MAVRRTTTACLLLVLMASPAVAADANLAASRAALWIVSKQQSNGAFFSPDYPADAVAETVGALISGAYRGAEVNKALDFVKREGPKRLSDAGLIGRSIGGIVAAGRDPRTFGGVDYVAKLQSFYDSATGAYDTRIYADALAVLGVLAARVPLPEAAITYLRANQCPSGGFYHDPGCPSLPDIDTTAIVISALTAAGLTAEDVAVQRARYFLLVAQNDEGGFGDSAGRTTNANSTGLALSAIAGLKEDPTGPPWRRSNGGNPVDALLSLRHSSGGFKYRTDQSEPNNYATVQAIPGLAGAAYPIRSGATTSGGSSPRGPSQENKSGVVRQTVAASQTEKAGLAQTLSPASSVLSESIALDHHRFGAPLRPQASLMRKNERRGIALVLVIGASIGQLWNPRLRLRFRAGSLKGRS